jgi:hypothetical protein
VKKPGRPRNLCKGGWVCHSIKVEPHWKPPLFVGKIRCSSIRRQNETKIPKMYFLSKLHQHGTKKGSWGPKMIPKWCQWTPKWHHKVVSGTRNATKIAQRGALLKNDENMTPGHLLFGVRICPKCTKTGIQKKVSKIARLLHICVSNFGTKMAAKCQKKRSRKTQTHRCQKKTKNARVW